MTDTASHNDPVHHPKHYNAHPSGLECWEVIRDMCCDAANAVKYVWRAGHKGKLAEDLNKAREYLQDQMRYPATYKPHSDDTMRKLVRVASCEQPHSLRRQFFLAMAEHQIGAALDTVNEMLTGVDITAIEIPTVAHNYGALIHHDDGSATGLVNVEGKTPILADDDFAGMTPAQRAAFHEHGVILRTDPAVANMHGTDPHDD